MKNALLIIAIAASGIFASLTRADVIPMTINSAQSFVDMSINNSPTERSQLSGTAVFDVQNCNPPSGSAQITDLHLVLDDALNFSFSGGAITVSTSPGDVSISMMTPGAPGNIAGNNFDQLANLLALDGDLVVVDPGGFVGGSQNFDLSTTTLDPVDFTSVTVTQSGNVVTITSLFTINEVLDFNGVMVPLVANVNYVASGVKAVPEPGSIALLMGLSTIFLFRRR